MSAAEWKSGGQRMTLSVWLARRAEDDLFTFGLWIAKQSDRQTARTYTDRIEAACGKLVDYPDRGSAREDLGPGMRSVVFERRVVIVYSVEAADLVVQRIVPRGRDLVRLFDAGA